MQQPTKKPLFKPTFKFGERIALSGRSGSGKTYWSRWFILKSRMNWLILDTKHDPNFDGDRPIGRLADMRTLDRLWKENPFIVIRPSPAELRLDILDRYLETLHESFDKFGILIDEVYQITNGNTIGPGFKGLITRGRARGQSLIMGAQRPVWIPKFVYSEANYYAIMSLNMPDDRKRIYELTGKREVLKQLQPRFWYWYDISLDKLTLVDPITISAPKA